MADINTRWMNAYAYKVKRCPRCKQQSFCLIFDSVEFGEEWECANNDCCYNPKCSCKNCGNK